MKIPYPGSGTSRSGSHSSAAAGGSSAKCGATALHRLALRRRRDGERERPSGAEPGLTAGGVRLKHGSSARAFVKKTEIVIVIHS